jgi:hypothetical protein
MSSASGPRCRRLDGLGLRRFAARYLLVFLAAVAITPHQHVNAIEDLLFDGPSDSGIVLEGSGPMDPMAGAQWSSARFTDDDPCLACFHNDWATEPIAFAILAPSFRSTTLTQRIHDAAIPSPPVCPRRSRAPPAFA